MHKRRQSVKNPHVSKIHHALLIMPDAMVLQYTGIGPQPKSSTFKPAEVVQSNWNKPCRTFSGKESQAVTLAYCFR